MGCSENFCGKRSARNGRVANIFSFSKAYGMMGWRLGVLAAPTALNDAMAKARTHAHTAQHSTHARTARKHARTYAHTIVKAHDTIAICAAAVAQRLALEVPRLACSHALHACARANTRTHSHMRKQILRSIKHKSTHTCARGHAYQSMAAITCISINGGHNFEHTYTCFCHACLGTCIGTKYGHQVWAPSVGTKL